MALSCDKQSVDNVLNILYNRSMHWMCVPFREGVTLPQIEAWFEHDFQDIAKATNPLLQVRQIEEETSTDALTYRVRDTQARPFNVDYLLQFYFDDEMHRCMILFYDASFEEVPLAPADVSLAPNQRGKTLAMSANVRELRNILLEFDVTDKEVDLGPNVTLDEALNVLEWLIETYIDLRRYKMLRWSDTYKGTLGLVLMQDEICKVQLQLGETTCEALYKYDEPRIPEEDKGKARIVLHITDCARHSDEQHETAGASTQCQMCGKPLVHW